MIIIDKSKEVQSIILTLSESTNITDVKYLLVLKSDATRKVYKFLLPKNVSTSKVRYDLFIVNTTAFDSMSTGYYTYKVYQSAIDSSSVDETLLGEAIEYGKLLIQSPKVNIPVVDKYIIYK